MGQDQSTDSYIESNDLLRYEPVSTEQDRRFGQITVQKDKQTGELVWIKELRIEDEATANRIKQHISTPEYLSDCFITIQSKLFDKSQSNVCGACSTSRKLIVILEYFERDLEGEILRRSQTGVNIFFLIFRNFFQSQKFGMCQKR